MGKMTTKQALDLMDTKGLSMYEVAKQSGLAYSTIYMACKRRDAATAKGRIACPCCGTWVPGESIKGDVASAIKAERDRIVAALREKGELTATCEAMADAIERLA